MGLRFDFDMYDSLLKAEGDTAQERTVNMMKEAFTRDVDEAPGYEANAKRNGVIQPMLFERGEVRYKVNVVCLPGDELYPGDLVEAYDETWICIETRAMDTLQTTGLLWLCNHVFQWQNFNDETINECYGVLDSGVYSTTKSGDAQLQTLDKQYKIYLPYNDITKMIFVDKRIATGKMYDQYGKEILMVYMITGVDHVSRSYGANAHLLILNARSDVYNPAVDNLEKEICDYYTNDDPTPTPVPEKLSCKIIGKHALPINKSRKYQAVFYNADGEVVTGITPIWQYSTLPDNVEAHVDGNGELVVTSNSKVYIGSTFNITLFDENGLYNPAALKVEVTQYV